MSTLLLLRSTISTPFGLTFATVKAMNLPQFFHLGQTWHIESGAALAALSDFANDLAIIQAGGKWSDTGAAQRKASAEITYEKTPSGRVAFVSLDGVMRMSDGLCSKGIQSLSNEVRQLSADGTVIAIVVDANTGGGEAIAGQEFANALAESTKPVLFYAHFLASAGVMASLQADEVYAAGKQTEVGSIGVKATVDNEMLDWYTKTYTDYYADTSQNKSEEFRALQAGDPSKIIASLNKADVIFMAEVQALRKLKGGASTVEETLSGRMFFAEDAVKRGLIDGIKTKAEVIARAEELAKKYSKTGRPKKDKKMANILVGTALGNILGIKDTDEQTDASVLQTLETKFSEMEASAEDLTIKLAASETLARNADTAKVVAEAKVAGLEARVAELEALNTQLADKAMDVKAHADTLQKSNQDLSKQVAALTLSTTEKAPPPNEVADSTRIENAAKKAFGGSVEVKV